VSGRSRAARRSRGAHPRTPAQSFHRSEEARDETDRLDGHPDLRAEVRAGIRAAAAAASESGTHCARLAAQQGAPHQEVLNQRALTILRRVDDKLSGRDFEPTRVLDVNEQVQVRARAAPAPERLTRPRAQKLVDQAMSNTNLCQCYAGWCGSRALGAVHATAARTDPVAAAHRCPFW
jgi:hypothetical protein